MGNKPDPWTVESRRVASEVTEPVEVIVEEVDPGDPLYSRATRIFVNHEGVIYFEATPEKLRQLVQRKVEAIRIGRVFRDTVRSKAWDAWRKRWGIEEPRKGKRHDKE